MSRNENNNSKYVAEAMHALRQKFKEMHTLNEESWVGIFLLSSC